jgi:uncharacterized protein (DUF1810 family)
VGLSDLRRFHEAQEGVYGQALAELRAGRKRTHWMWFIFPQYAGLGRSAMSEYYAINSVDEARAYLDDPVLGHRLRECAAAILALREPSASAVFGHPDDLKLRSSATLFARIEPEGSVFHQVLDRFFDGKSDPATLALIGKWPDDQMAR